MLSLTGFNSTMVRLKGQIRLRDEHVHQCFNSTMVRLKAWQSQAVRRSTSCFNSTMVRLKARKINGDIIQNPHYFYKEKNVSSFKSRQRPVVQN